MNATTTQTASRRAAQVISLAMNGISIHHIKAIPNRWDGYDLDLEKGRLLRVTIEDGQIEVFTFDAYQCMETKATFSFSAPPLAVAAYVGAMI